MILPTTRAVGLFALGVPLGLVILTIDPQLWAFSFDLSLFVALAFGLDALIVAPVQSVRLSVLAPSQLPAGSQGRITVGLGATGRTRPHEVEALIDLVGPVEPPLPVRARLFEADSQVDFPLLPQRRGVIELKALWLRWRGPLGMVECRFRRDLSSSINILPARRIGYGKHLKSLIDSAIHGIKPQDRKGEGTEFDSLREHVAGLDTRFIDWKQSARHRKLYSKEFRVESNHQIVLAFDTGHLMLEPIEGLARLDHAIEAGLMLGATALRAGDLVGSFAFDSRVRSYIEPGRGAAYYSRLQRGAAHIGYRTEQTNFTLGLAELNARLRRRALVVLFTEFVDAIMAELLVDSLKRMASHHAVIFVTLRDPAIAALKDAEPDSFEAIAESVIAHGVAREKALALERISRLGVRFVDVPLGGLGVALISRYLDIKQEGML